MEKSIGIDEPDKEREDEAPSWCVYVLRCNDRSFYTGATSNLKKRLLTHQEGKGSRYVRSHLPFVVAKIIGCEDEHEARSLEYRLKRMTRSQKVALLGLDKATIRDPGGQHSG
jgi:putative endonuclease